MLALATAAFREAKDLAPNAVDRTQPTKACRGGKVYRRDPARC